MTPALRALLPAAAALALGGPNDHAIERLARCARAQAAEEECAAVLDYLAANDHHRDGDEVFMADEWEVRRELAKRGVDLPKSAIPLDLAARRGPWGEVLVVFDWGYVGPRTQGSLHNRKDAQARRLGFLTGELLKSRFDGGPFNRYFIYARRPKEPFRLHLYGELAGAWFDGRENDCPPLRRLDGKRGVCFRARGRGFPDVELLDEVGGAGGTVVKRLTFDGEYRPAP